MARDREEGGREEGEVRPCVRNRKRGVYGPLPPHAVKRTWKEGMTVVKDIEHGRRPQPLLNCYVLKTNAARAVQSDETR